MAKQSQLDKAIESIKADIAVLELAIRKLEDQRRAQKPAKVRKPVAVRESA